MMWTDADTAEQIRRAKIRHETVHCDYREGPDFVPCERTAVAVFITADHVHCARPVCRPHAKMARAAGRHVYSLSLKKISD